MRMRKQERPAYFLFDEMSPGAIRRLLLSALLSAALLITTAHAQTVDESTIRDAFGLDENTEVIYANEDGQRISFEQFSVLIQKGMHATLDRDESGVATIILSRSQPTMAPAAAAQFSKLDLVDLNGRRVIASDPTGKYTLVSFFFAECVPCIEEVPALNDYAQENPNVRVVAMTFDDRKTALQFVREHGFSWPVVAEAQDFISAVGIEAYPSFALLDPNGSLLGIESGVPKPAAGARTAAKDIRNIVDQLRRAGRAR